MCQEPDAECPEGCVELLFILLKKRPKQYQEAVKTAQGLLEKISEKLVKSKEVRQSKKEKIKEKMEAGVYLPKEVYQLQREHKRDKVLTEMKQGKKRREKEIIKKKQQHILEKGAKRAEQTGKFSRDNKDGAPKKFTRDNDRDTSANKFTKEEGAAPVKRYEPRKFEKGDQNPVPDRKSAGGRTQPPSSFNKYEKSDRSRQPQAPVQNTERKDKSSGKTSHPSWEAKKEQRKLETSIKFIKGEEIEL